MPKFRVLNQVDRIKPGASVMASVLGEDNKRMPALVVQRYGHGKSGALLIGDMWRWQMAGKQKRGSAPRMAADHQMTRDGCARPECSWPRRRTRGRPGWVAG